MADIATLGIEVTTKGVQQAEQQLGKLAQTGAATEKEVAKVAPAMERAAKSAKELQFATRGLPAQFTDIVTSLASGQRPLQVLFQQGGQLKDMFGGTGAAARALGGYIAGLVNPLTLTAAAAAGLALAWHEAEAETEAFNRALILTGNYAGTTAAQLDLMAARIDAGNSSYSEAAKVIAQVASTGRFTAEQIEQVSTAALAAQQQLGIGVEDTIKKFVALGQDPVEAILKLNDTEHFLTESVYEQIKSLQEQGSQMAAGEVAVASYAKVTRERAAQMEGDVNHLTEAWRALKRTIAEVADTAIGVFRTGPSQQIKELQGNLDRLRKGEGLYAELSAATRARLAKQFEDKINAIEKRGQAAAASTTKDKPVDSASERARQEFERAGLRYLDDRARKLKDIADVEKLVTNKVIERGEADKRIAQINAFYARQAPKARNARTAKPRTLNDTETGETLLGQLKQQIELNQAAAIAEDSLSASQRLAVVAKLQLAKITGTVTGARRAEIDAALAELKTTDDLARKREDAIKLADDLARATNEIAAAQLNQARASEVELLSLTRGRQATDQAARRLEIERDFQDQVRALRDRGVAEDSDSYREQVALYQKSRDAMLAAEEDHQRKLAAVRADWRNGARAAVEDYRTQAEDVAGQTYDIVSNAFGGLEDVLTEFFTKGKADFRGFLDAIAADITRFVVRQQLAKLAKKFLPALGGEGDSASALSSAAGQLAASAAPLLGAATALSASAAALAAAGVAAGGQGGASAGSLGGFGNLISSFLSGGFASGGYTGPGGRNQPAGIVHKGEIVWSQADVARAGGVGAVEGMRRGGGMGGPAPVLNQTFVVNGTPDRTTREQMARTSGREAARGMSRTGR